MSKPAMCGAPTEMKEVTDEIREIGEKIRAELEGKVGQKFKQYKATHYISQLVAGTNFWIKFAVDDGKFVHVRIFRPLPGQGELSVADYQLNKAAEDPLVYF